MLETFVLDTFADENTTKPMDFQNFDRTKNFLVSWEGGDRSKQVIFFLPKFSEFSVFFDFLFDLLRI